MEAHMRLPIPFVFMRPYSRTKGRFALRPEGVFIEDEHHELFRVGLEITFVDQSRSLLGIRWKTREGFLFSPDEFVYLLRSRTLERVSDAKALGP